MAVVNGAGPLAADHGEFWLFGYGSLIWKPPPHYDRRIPGWVTGFVRRFWQASQDHRGTPEKPGRVVTLLERSHWETLVDEHQEAPEKVWGTAYHFPADKADEVKEYLDIREINGYSIHYTPFHPADGSSSIRTMAYIGTPDNDQFVGPQDVEKLARHIYHSEGPSGLNRDYLWSLHQALEELSVESHDEHVTKLAEYVRAIDREERKRRDTQPITAFGTAANVAPHPPPPGVLISSKGASGAPHHEFVTSTEEQEETEKP